MKKWDEERKLRTHINKVINAKGVIIGVQKSNKRISRETDFTSHASYRSEQFDMREYPLYRQLSEYNLQQYAFKLINRGYGNGLEPLTRMSVDYQQQMLSEIKLLPGHKQKFEELLKHLPEPIIDNRHMIIEPKIKHLPKLNERHTSIEKTTYGKTSSSVKLKFSRQPPNLQTQVIQPILQKQSSQKDLQTVVPKSKKKFKRSRLMRHLEQLQFTDIDLTQVKQMYQSIDNAKLASTMINIDIQEICTCLATLLQKRILIVDLKEQIVDQDYFEDEYQNEFEQLSRRSSSHLSEMRDNEISFTNQDRSTNDLVNNDESEMKQTKSQFSSFLEVVATDRDLFESEFSNDQLLRSIPSIEVIQNYCKNIMITTKMEREIAILSLIYIDRLLIRNKLRITCFNWQNVIFTSMVIASKIWDDESFENNNFAKVFPQFTTIKINVMEMIFLRLIDYRLYVRQGEYSDYYFRLRTYATKKIRSYPLKQLDVQTIIRLQRKIEVIEKSQFLAPLNHSF